MSRKAHPRAPSVAYYRRWEELTPEEQALWAAIGSPTTMNAMVQTDSIPENGILPKVVLPPPPPRAPPLSTAANRKGTSDRKTLPQTRSNVATPTGGLGDLAIEVAERARKRAAERGVPILEGGGSGKYLSHPNYNTKT